MEKDAKEENKLFISLAKEHVEKTDEISKLVMKMRMLTPLKPDSQHVYVVSGQIKVDVSEFKAEKLESLDIQIGSRIGDVWSFKAPYNSIEKMNEIAGVKTIKLDKKIKFIGVAKRSDGPSE